MEDNTFENIHCHTCPDNMNVKFVKNYYVRKRQLIIVHHNKYNGGTYICDNDCSNNYIPAFETREEAEEYVSEKMQYASETRPTEIPENLLPTFPSEASENGRGGLIYKGPVENSIICEIYCTYERCLGYGRNAVIKRKKEPLFTVYENYVIFDGYFPYTEENLQVTDNCEI